MLRYPSNGPMDTVAKQDGDLALVGVEQRIAPPSLPQGYVSDAENCRFNQGRAESRPGHPMIPCVKDDGYTPFDEVYGGVIFSDPNQTGEWWLIAADGGVWKTRAGTAATAVAMPASVTLTRDTFKQMVQCFNVIILLRGEDDAPLVCEDLDEGFKSVPSTVDGTYTQPIPDGTFGLFYLNRLVVAYNRDNVAVSDALEYTRYYPPGNSFRIQEGNDDALVAIAPIGDDTLVMLKDNSILRVDGLADGPANATLRHVTNRFGCVAARTVVDVGSDLYWLSERGVVSLRLTETNAVQPTDQALSDPMIRTVRRINRRHVTNACAESWDGKLYVAVPIDDACLHGAELIARGITVDSDTVTVDDDEITADSDVDKYSSTAPLVVTVTAGSSYSYVQGVNGTALVNGSETLTGSGTFTAQGSTVSLETGSTVEITCFDSLRLICAASTNNCVMVYSFVNGAWAGNDTGDAVCVRQFLKPMIDGVRRLVALCDDGFLRLWEEGAFDQVPDVWDQPILNVSVASLPVDGVSTIQVNGGSLRTAALASPDWDSTSLLLAQNTLWLSETGGYKPAVEGDGRLGYSTAPDTTPSETSRGVKFTSTNGVLPTLLIDGVTITASGIYGWASVDVYSGDYARAVAPQFSVTTRGYVCQDPDQKQFRHLTVQMKTWGPDYTVTVINGGVSEESDLGVPGTRSRTASTVFGQAAWDDTNVNGDHDDSGREDYSVVIPETGMYFAEGLALNLRQASAHQLAVSRRSHWLQVRVDNTEGAIEVYGVQVQALEGNRSDGIIY